MARLVVLAAVVLICAYLVARGWARLKSRLEEVLSESVAGRPRKHGSELVACATCGVHIPQSRALTPPAGGVRPALAAPRSYCSEDCRRRAADPPEVIRVKSA